MRSLIMLILFLVLTFSLNVMFYYVSEDYRVFLQEIKIEKIPQNKQIIEENKDINEEKLLEENTSIIETTNKNDEIFEKNEDNKIEIKQEVKLGKSYVDILNLLSSYDLKELEINTSLFDITTEYPDKYIEYYSKWLTLYFFPTKTYKQVYDIFEVLEYELPYTLNQVNNFWDYSFYINLNDDINDSTVRLVVSYKWITFGLKIKKNEYNLVKEKLNSLKPNQATNE